MKHKLNNYIKLGILLFGISTVILSCQKEESLILEQGNEQTISPKSIIDFNSFLNKFGTTTNAKSKTTTKQKHFSLENYTFGYLPNVASRESDQSIIQYIDTTTIVAFEFDNIQTYTFNIVPTVETENTFYNIIFYQNSEGTQSKLLKYESDFEWENSNDTPFSGVIYEIEEDETVINTYTIAQQTSNTNVANRIITDCVFSVSTTTIPCTGLDEQGNPVNHTNVSDCTCGVSPNSSCSPPSTYTVTDLVCETYNTGGGEIPDEGGTTSGTENSNPNENDDGTFNLPTDPVKGSNVNWTTFFNDLSTENQTFLNSNTIVRNQIQYFLLQNYFSIDAVSFSNEILNIANLDANIDSNALAFVLEAKNQSKIYNAFDTAFLSSVNQYMNIDTSDAAHTDPVYLYFIMKCIELRALHPEWSDIKIYWEASKEIVHIGLDIFGLIPLIGEPADIINGVLYTIEGDGINATLSFASALPLAGWVSFGTKYAIKIVDATQTATTVVRKVKLTWKVTTNGIEFGQRSQLRKILGLAVGNPDQAHHIIPWAKRTSEVVQQAAKSGNAFHMNEALNGIAVAAWRNQPNHNLYNQRVQELFNALPSSLTPDEAYNAITNIVNTHLNDLIF